MKRAVGLADLPTLVRDTAFAAPVITNSFVTRLGRWVTGAS